MLIPQYGLLVAGVITLLSILMLFVLNILVQKTKVDFVYYKNMDKTILEKIKSVFKKPKINMVY